MGATKEEQDREQPRPSGEEKRTEGQDPRNKQEAITTEAKGPDGKKVTLKDIRGGGA